MECFNCNNELSNTETVFAKEYDNRVIVIKKVPVLKCGQCGEEYFKPKENDNIGKIVSEILNDNSKDSDVIIAYREIVDIPSKEGVIMEKNNFLYGSENRLNQLLERDGTHKDDLERKALFYIIAGNDDLYSKVDFIYDFEDNSINPDCLESEEIDFCSSSRKLIKLAFNLYNSYPADVIDTFYLLDENNFNLALNAIKLRLNRI